MKTYELINGVPVFGEPIENAVQQLADVQDMAERCVLMADHHHGYDVPIGSVMAYDGQVSPAGVGFDIACGNKAVRLNLQYGDIKDRMEDVMDAVWRTIEFGPGKTNREPIDDRGLMDDEIWNEEFMRGIDRKKSEGQLGTTGGGNHYVDIFGELPQRPTFSDDDGLSLHDNSPVWIGVHFGSRGLGHTLGGKFMKLAAKISNGQANALLDVSQPSGSDYLAAMTFAGNYATVGRDFVCDRVAELIGADIVEEVHNHHNYAWLEKHDERMLYVVRKGATPCRPGQLSFVGSTMGDVSYVLEGIDSDDSRLTMYSTVHGAGRAMSRTQAAGKVKRGRRGKPNRVIKEGLIKRDDMLKYVWDRGIELRGAGVDEAPMAYKRLDDVLDYHRNTVNIRNLLMPIGVAMAGSGRR